METLEVIKVVVRESSKPDHGKKPHIMEFLKRSAVADHNLAEVVELVEEVLIEKAEAKQCEITIVAEKERLAKELEDTKDLYTQSQSLCTTVEDEKNILEDRLSKLQRTVDALQTQNDSLSNSSRKMQIKFSEVQSELRSLLEVKDELLGTVKNLKDLNEVFQAADPRAESAEQHSQQSPREPSGYGAELVRMAERLVKQRDEARLGGRQYEEEKKKRENELADLTSRISQLQAFCTSLEERNEGLERGLRDYRSTFRSIEGSICDLSGSEAQTSDIGQMKNVMSEVVTMKGRLQATESKYAHDRALIEEILREIRYIFEIADDRDSSERESEVSAILFSLKLFKTEYDRSSAAARDHQGLHEILLIQMTKLLDVMGPSPGPSASNLDRDDNESDDVPLSKTQLPVGLQCNFVDDELRTTIMHMPTLVDEVGKLKREKDHLVDFLKGMDTDLQIKVGELQSVVDEAENLRKEKIRLLERLKDTELQKDHAIRRNSEHEETMLKMTQTYNNDRQNASELQSQMEIIQAVVNSISKERKLLKDELAFAGSEDNESIKDNQILREIEGIKDELLVLRTQNADFQLRINELVSTGGSAHIRAGELSEKLTLAEARAQNFSARASAADLLENQLENAKAESSDLAKKLASAEVQLQTLSGHVSALDSLQDQNAAAETKAAELGRKLVAVEEQLHIASTRASVAESLGDQRAAEAETQLSDLAMKLSTAEGQLRTMSARASVADLLESETVAASAQLSELFGMIESMDRVQGTSGSNTNSERQTESMNIAARTTAVKSAIRDILAAKEEGASERTREIAKLKGQTELSEAELRLSKAEMDKLKEQLNGQAESIRKHTADWTKLVENLKGELNRVGGRDLKDEADKLKKATAMEKVKELLAAALSRNPPLANQPSISAGPSASSSPLLSFGKFQVDLLVNSKVHSQLKVSGHNGGICQAVLHYFRVDPTSGDITFENATIPGSQSSNLIVELFLQPFDSKKEYQAQAGDNLGLSVKIQEFNQGAPREILFNANVVRTNEVMEAIDGQTLQNFSLWPDLVSSWRWELDSNKNKWKLMSIRWRFLLKNIFPTLSPPLQILTTKESSLSRSTSVHISYDIP